MIVKNLCPFLGAKIAECISFALFFFFPWLLTACAGAELKPVFLFKCTEAGGCQGVLGWWACRCSPPVFTKPTGQSPSARWVPAALTLASREGTNAVTPPFVDEDTEAAGAFFYSLFNKYLWKTYYVQGMALSSSNTAINERDKNSYSRGASVSEERGRGNEKYTLPPGVMSAMGK